MTKTIIVNLNVRISMNEDADLQEVVQNASVSLQDTTGKAEIDEAHILNYIEVD